MSDQTPEFTLDLEFDEYALQRMLRCAESGNYKSAGRVPLTCVAQRIDGDDRFEFAIDAARCPSHLLAQLDDQECKSRVFFYLNGLLKALAKLRMRARSARSVLVRTNVRYLAHNANFERVRRWKKRGFQSSDGEDPSRRLRGNTSDVRDPSRRLRENTSGVREKIKMRALWNQFYEWCVGPVAFHPLKVVLYTDMKRERPTDDVPRK